jgi:hypothetical protein
LALSHWLLAKDQKLNRRKPLLALGFWPKPKAKAKNQRRHHNNALAANQHLGPLEYSPKHKRLICAEMVFGDGEAVLLDHKSVEALPFKERVPARWAEVNKSCGRPPKSSSNWMQEKQPLALGR